MKKALLLFVIEFFWLSFFVYIAKDDIADFFKNNLNIDISNILYSEVFEYFASIGFGMGIFMIVLIFFIAMVISDSNKSKKQKVKSNGFWIGLFLGWLFFGGNDEK
jgi:hypothetical protein